MANDRVVFRLKDLMWLFVVAAATIWIGYVSLVPSLGHPTYTWAVNGVLRAQDRVTFRWEMCQHAGISVSDDVFNLWLAHDLPTEHAASQTLDDPPPLDVWGNPYQVRRRSTPLDPPLVYSLGEDGVSLTDGMDADDIRAWQASPERWYSHRERWRHVFLLLVIGLCLSVLLYFALGFRPAKRLPSTDRSPSR